MFGRSVDRWSGGTGRRCPEERYRTGAGSSRRRERGSRCGNQKPVLRSPMRWTSSRRTRRGGSSRRNSRQLLTTTTMRPSCCNENNRFCIFKRANPGLFFVYFRSFLITISMIQIEKRVDGELGIRTRGCMMVGADDTTELWRPTILHFTSVFKWAHPLPLFVYFRSFQTNSTVFR